MASFGIGNLSAGYSNGSYNQSYTVCTPTPVISGCTTFNPGQPNTYSAGYSLGPLSLHYGSDNTLTACFGSSNANGCYSATVPDRVLNDFNRMEKIPGFY